MDGLVENNELKQMNLELQLLSAELAVRGFSPSLGCARQFGDEFHSRGCQRIIQDRKVTYD